MNFLTRLIGSAGGGLLESVSNVVDKFVTTDKDKAEMKIALIEVLSKDKDSARSMYEKDSWLQKAYAIVFLVGYIGISVYIIYILTGDTVISQTASTFITMIFTAMSMKINTIVDFLFGGSLSGNSDKKLM